MAMQSLPGPTKLTPCLERESVVTALSAMLQGKDLAPYHPLTQFISFFLSDLQLDGEKATQSQIFHRLSQIICRRLNAHRRHHSLSMATPYQDSVGIVADF